MRRLVFAAVAAGLLAGPVRAADSPADPRQAPAAPEVRQPVNAPAERSFARTEKFFKHLALTEQQVAKIDALQSDLQAAMADLAKKSGMRGAVPPEKADPIRAAYKAKMLDVLDAGQRAKYEAAAKIEADSLKAVGELSAKFKASPQAPGDAKAFSEGLAKIGKERDEALAKLFGYADKPPGGAGK